MAQRKGINSLNLSNLIGGFTKTSNLGNDFYIEEVRACTELEKKLIDEHFKAISDKTISVEDREKEINFVDEFIQYLHIEKKKTHADYNVKEEKNNKNNNVYIWSLFGLCVLGLVCDFICNTKKK